MASQIWVSGACHVFIGFGPIGSGSLGGGAPSSAHYLGTGERAPYWQVVPGYSPLFSDLGGTVYPFDVVYSGLEAFVTVRLTRWNYKTLQKVEALSPGGNVGFDFIDGVGTLPMLEDAIGMHLYLTFPYSSPIGAEPRLIQAMAAQPKGIHFHLAELESIAGQPGTGPNWYDLTWRCRRAYDPGNGIFITYDNDVSGLPEPD